jgi:hypothetical protein
MSADKLSPGPWSIDSDGFLTDAKGGRLFGVAVLDRDAEVCWYSDADRAVATAAPELLECLQYLIQGKPGEVQFDRFYDERVKAARAAIAKATGKDTK